MIVVTFYTKDWEYEERAFKLKKQCEDLGLSTDFRERPSSSTWIANTAMKARFIYEMLQEHEHILWLDCDGSLNKMPNSVLNQTKPIAVTKHSTMADHPTSPRRYATGIMGIKRTPATLKMIEAWMKYAEENGATDELAFEKTVIPRLVEILPDNYLSIMNVSYDNSAVYGLGLSTSPDKMAMKDRQGKLKKG